MKPQAISVRMVFYKLSWKFKEHNVAFPFMDIFCPFFIGITTGTYDVASKLNNNTSSNIIPQGSAEPPLILPTHQQFLSTVYVSVLLDMVFIEFVENPNEIFCNFSVSSLERVKKGGFYDQSTDQLNMILCSS